MSLRIPQDTLSQLLRDEKIKEFNQQKPQAAQLDFHDCDFRGLDLRGLDASGINFSGSYFRAADLRGIDFSQTNLHGASIISAQISGCFFPSNIDATEILLSVEKGMRMRAKP